MAHPPPTHPDEDLDESVQVEVSFVAPSEVDLLYVLGKLRSHCRSGAGFVTGDEVALLDINGNRVGTARASAAQ